MVGDRGKKERNKKMMKSGTGTRTRLAKGAKQIIPAQWLIVCYPNKEEPGGLREVDGCKNGLRSL